MKNLFLLSITLFIFCGISVAQEWNGNAPNTLFAENSANQVSPISVGIGTSIPQTQLHTTGTVRFTGLTPSATVPPSVIGQASNGDLLTFSSDLLGGNSWLTTGNTVDGTQFIGTLNAQSFRIRTNNTERMVVNPQGRVGINSPNPAMQLDTRYAGGGYSPTLAGNGMWSASDGFFLYNTGGSSSSITLGSVSGGQLSIAKINSIGRTGQSEITFQTENTIDNTGDMIHERMRITNDGTVEINTRDNDDNMLALHTVNELQFDNLPIGRGRPLVINSSNRVQISGGIVAYESEVKELEARVEFLENQLLNIVANLNMQSAIETELKESLNGDLYQNNPNPASDYTQIDYSIKGDFRNAKMLLFNQSGQLINEYSILDDEGTLEIDTHQLANGAYIYSLEINGKIIKSNKLIKQARF